MRDHFIIHTPRGYVGQRRALGRLYDDVARDDAVIFASFELATLALHEFRDGEVLPCEPPAPAEPERRNHVEQQMIDRRHREMELLARDYD